MPDALHLLIVDDHALFREGIESILAVRLPHARLCCVEDAAAAEAALEASGVDLLLLDVDLGHENGLDLLARWRQRWPALCIVMLSANNEPGLMRRAIDLGARGFVPKGSNGALLVGVVELVLAGGTYLPLELLAATPGTDDTTQCGVSAVSAPGDQDAVDGQPGQSLTPRQQEVLSLLADGCSNKEIARRLTMADGTVRAHINALFRILEVNNRTQAVIRAQQRHCL